MQLSYGTKKDCWLHERIIIIYVYTSAVLDHLIPTITFSTHFDFLGSQRQEEGKLTMVAKVETPMSSPNARICD